MKHNYSFIADYVKTRKLANGKWETSWFTTPSINAVDHREYVSDYKAAALAVREEIIETMMETGSCFKLPEDFE